LARRSISSCHTSRSTRPGDGSLKKLLSLLENLPEDLASQAFTHSSWTEERQNSYERLAFLGDSVLNISVSRVLFPRFSSSTAGKLTKIRAQAVSRRSCVEVARQMEIPERVRAAAPEGYEHQSERLVEADSVLAEVVEAVIGACFLEFGFEQTSVAVAEAFEPQVEWAIAHHSDFKSELQERLAQRGEIVIYRVVSEDGPPHDRMFETVAEVSGRALGSGSGRSKKESEQEAAKMALEKLDAEDA